MFHMPMSSPMMKTMLGLSAAAAAPDRPSRIATAANPLRTFVFNQFFNTVSLLQDVLLIYIRLFLVHAVIAFKSSLRASSLPGLGRWRGTLALAQRAQAPSSPSSSSILLKTGSSSSLDAKRARRPELRCSTRPENPAQIFESKRQWRAPAYRHLANRHASGKTFGDATPAAGECIEIGQEYFTTAELAGV